MTMSNVKIFRIVKYFVVILIFWLIYIMMHPTWTEIETWEHLKAMQKKHEGKKDQSALEHGPVLKNPNAIHFDDDKALDIKSKIKLINQKLQPKLMAGPSYNEEGDVIWDDIGAARNQEDVQLRDEGYRRFAFNSLVSTRIGFKRDVPDTRY